MIKCKQIYDKIGVIILPETNIVPENWWLED